MAKPKRELDQFDQEAMAEGNAIRVSNDFRPHRKGKKTCKSQSLMQRGESIHQSRADRRFLVKD